jgi:uncharacterized protein YegL
MATHERGPAWVARKTGYTREWISAVLHGQKPFSDKLAQRLTEVLGLAFAEPGSAAGLQRDTDLELALNPEPPCPCVLLLDTSAAIQGRPLEELQQGLRVFQAALLDDEQAARQVEVALITFDTQVRVVQKFVRADRFEPPILTAQGRARMGAAIDSALDLLEARQAQYRDVGIAWYCPWVVLVTNGEPQGEDEEEIARAARRLKEAEMHQEVVFFAIGVENANMVRLSHLTMSRPYKLRELQFQKLFCWLSSSMHKVAHSQLGEAVAIDFPDGVALHV